MVGAGPRACPVRQPRTLRYTTRAGTGTCPYVCVARRVIMLWFDRLPQCSYPAMIEYSITLIAAPRAALLPIQRRPGDWGVWRSERDLAHDGSGREYQRRRSPHGA